MVLFSAPHGQYIKIEFRDRFGMEASPNCEYDRLEIRNGQHGYSDLLTTLCGHNFPQEIHSTDNYLWLRFVSDENIEYEGFKGVYTFLRQASKLFTCGHTHSTLCSLLQFTYPFQSLVNLMMNKN